MKKLGLMTPNCDDDNDDVQNMVEKDQEILRDTTGGDITVSQIIDTIQ